MEALLPLVLGIVRDGLKLWSEERRTRFLSKHHKLLQGLADAENKAFPEYNDADVDILKENLEIYLKAYWMELKDEATEREVKK